MIIEWKKKKSLYLECDNMISMDLESGGTNLMISNIDNIDVDNYKLVKSYLESWQNVSIGSCVFMFRQPKSYVDKDLVFIDSSSDTDYINTYYFLDNNRLKYFEFDLRGNLSKCIFKIEDGKGLVDITRSYKIENLLSNL